MSLPDIFKIEDCPGKKRSNWKVTKEQTGTHNSAFTNFSNNKCNNN